MLKRIERSIQVQQTPRVKQACGLFDLAPTLRSEQVWDVDLSALPAEWNVGVIVGPSGAGKSTIAREVFGEDLVAGWDWPGDKSILDGFPPGMGIKDITGLLSSVGFSSPPAWLVPFRVLSNGQQFRVNLGRTLAEKPGLAVVDEFGSFVQQQVRQVAAAAVAKAVRRAGRRFIAVTCHDDAVAYFEPDWVMEVRPGQPVRVKPVRGSVRRPPIELEVVRCDGDAWARHGFRENHYLSGELHRGAKCFLGTVGGLPAAFTAVLPFPHARRSGWREHRTVCLPDFQGVGIGNAMSELVASLFVATGRPYFSSTSHPSMIGHRRRSPLWRMTRKLGLSSAHGNAGDVRMGNVGSVARITAGFEYVGPARTAEARALAVVPAPERQTIAAGLGRGTVRSTPPVPVPTPTRRDR